MHICLGLLKIGNIISLGDVIIIKRNKKIILTIIAIGAIGILAAIKICVFISDNQMPYIPVEHTFDPDTGEITFKIDDGYLIHRVSASEGHYEIADYGREIRELSFSAWDLDVGEHDFIYFVCHKEGGSELEERTVEFEILRQSSQEVMITVFPGNRDRPARSETYSYFHDERA